MSVKVNRMIFGMVARGEEVLAEFSPDDYKGNFMQITAVLLKKIDPSTDLRRSLVSSKDGQSFSFHYLVAAGITYLCMADAEFSRVVAFKFLSNIQSSFVATYKERAKTLRAYQANTDFKHSIESQLQRANSDSNNKIAQVSKQLDDIKGVMIDNIDKVLEREELIVDLMDKSENLSSNAEQFHRKSRKLKNAMWWQNCKIKLIIGTVLLAVIVVIILILCDGSC